MKRKMADTGCKALLIIGIQTHKKLDNNALNVYPIGVSAADFQLSA